VLVAKVVLVVLVALVIVVDAHVVVVTLSTSNTVEAQFCDRQA
jgi:hypothetical protein